MRDLTNAINMHFNYYIIETELKSHFNSKPLTVLGETEEDTDQLRWYTYDKLGSISYELRFGYCCHVTECSTTTTIKHFSAANDSYINQV